MLLHEEFNSNTNSEAVSFCNKNDDPAIASSYQSNKLSIVYMPGFNGKLTNSRANFIRETCKTHNIPFLTFNPKHFENDNLLGQYTIGYHIALTKSMLEAYKKPKIVIANSNSTWIILATLNRHPQLKLNIKGLILFSPAVHMHKTIESFLSTEDKLSLATNNEVKCPSELGYNNLIIPQKFFTNATHNMITRPVDLSQIPVSILYGTKDEYSAPFSEKNYAKLINSNAVTIIKYEDCGHNLDDKQAIPDIMNIYNKLDAQPKPFIIFHNGKTQTYTPF